MNLLRREAVPTDRQATAEQAVDHGSYIEASRRRSRQAAAAVSTITLAHSTGSRAGTTASVARIIPVS